MKVVILRSALTDVLWMRRYYSQIFPEGARRAEAQLNGAKRLLSEQPYAGHSRAEDGTLEFPILKTPFSLIYRVGEDKVEILRIRDQRRSHQHYTI